MTAASLPLTTSYHYAAARLAVEHAERRLQNALAILMHSLDEPGAARAPLANALSTRLAQFRESLPPRNAAIGLVDEKPGAGLAAAARAA